MPTGFVTWQGWAVGSGRTVATSYLVQNEWVQADGEHSHIVTVEFPIHAEVARFEDTCRPHRPPEQKEWDWRLFVGKYDDHYAMRIDDGELVGMWAATKSGSDYVVEFVEVVPDMRGRRIWGPLLFAFVCARAHELQANRVVFGSLPERAAWYRRLGARDGVAGWTPGPDLVPMHVDAQTIVEIVARLG